MFTKENMQTFIQVSREFYASKIWEDFENMDCIGVRFEGEEEFYACVVMGDGGMEFGMMIFKGEDSIGDFSEFANYESVEAMENADIISFGMEKFKEIDQSVQDAYRQSGIKPKPNEIMPFILTKESKKESRLPDDGELVLMTRIVRAVNEAYAKGLIEPATPDDPDGISVITIGRDGTFTTAREKTGLAKERARRLEARVAQLANLPILEEQWVAGTLVCGVEEEDDCDLTLIVYNKLTGEIIGHGVSQLSEYDFIQEIMASVFEGQGKNQKKGLPRKIIFNSEMLFNLYEPTLKKAGCEVMFESNEQLGVELENKMNEVVKSIITSDSFTKVADPDDLETWMNAMETLNRKFMDYNHSGRRHWDDEAELKYLGELEMEIFEEDENFALAFGRWVYMDYVMKGKEKPAIDAMHDNGSLSAMTVELVNALRESWPSIYMAKEVDPKAGCFVMKDLLLGEEIRVNNKFATQAVKEGLIYPAFVFKMGNYQSVQSAGPGLYEDEIGELKKFLKEQGMEFTREGLRRDSYLFGRIWMWAWSREYEEGPDEDTEYDQMMHSLGMKGSENLGGLDWESAEPIQPIHSTKIGRNEPCPCGSGKKYKKCCGKNG